MASAARRWLAVREDARERGGGLFYWFFGYLGFGMTAIFVFKWANERGHLAFPADLGLGVLIAWMWVRSSIYRLKPVKMFGVTLIALAVLLGTLR